MNIKLSEKALEEIKKVASTREKMKALRIYIAAYGWGGPSFGLALDEPKENDLSVKVDEFDFVIEDNLKDVYGGFDVDYNTGWLQKGFVVVPTGGSTASC